MSNAPYHVAACRSRSWHRAPPDFAGCDCQARVPRLRATPTPCGKRGQRAGRVGAVCHSTFSMVSMGLATPTNLEKNVNMLCVETVGLTQNETGLQLATKFKKTFGLVPTWNCIPPSSNSAVQPVWVQVPRNYFIKALFFEKPGFHNREGAAENTVSLADGGEAIAFILRYLLSLFSCKTCI